MSLTLLFHYLMLNIFRMLIRPSSGACDLFVELLHGLYCSGMMCVGVTLWFGWGGVVSGCRLHPDTTCTVHSTQCIVYNVPFTMNIAQRTVHNVRCRMHSAQCTHPTRAIQPMK